MPVRQRQVRNRTQLPYPVPRKAGQTASPTRNRCQSLQDPCLAGDRAPDPTEFCKCLGLPEIFVTAIYCVVEIQALSSVCRKTPFLEFEPASAVKFDPDLTGGFRVKWTWSATFGGKRRAGGDFGAHIGDFRKYRAWRAAGSPVRAALAGFPGDVRQLFVAGT